MRAYILIDIRTGEIKNVVDMIQRIDGVIEAKATFGQYDAIAVVEGDDVDQIGRVMATKIQTIPGVLETITCLAIDL